MLEWDIFRQKNMHEIKAARKMVEHSSVNVDVPSARGTIVQRRFSPDQSLKPKLLDESANLLEVKDFIIEFSNYIQSGYNPGETAATGHYIQMRNVLKHGWIERMDRRKAMEKGLKDLCNLLQEEAEKKYPKHQRRKNLLKMKKHQNESNIAFLRRVRKNLEVAEIETMTSEELGMHIFIEQTDQILGKLAIDELQKEVPSLDNLENAVEATEVSAWYEHQSSRKGYSKVAISKTSKQCSKCNRQGHSQEECWGVCKWCKKSNHPAVDATTSLRTMELWKR